MRDVSDVRRSPFVGVIVFVMLLALVVPRGIAVADNHGSDGDEMPGRPQGNLPEGEWLGDFNASGNFVGDFDGSSADVAVLVRGSLGFDSSGGSLSGEWSMWALQLHRLQTPGGEGRGVFTTNADGAVGGSGRTIRMTGDGTTAGTVIIAGGSQNVGPNAHGVGPMEVRGDFASCNLIVGDWVTPLTALIDTTGLTGSLDGSFAASYQGELDSDLRERFEQLRLDLNEWERDFLETDALDAERIFPLLDRIAAMEYEVRGVGQACEFGPDLDRDDFTRFLTAAMRDLLWLALTRGTPHAEGLDRVVTVLLDFGIVGSGSQNQGTAAEFAGEVKKQVDRILAEEILLQTDGEHPVSGVPCTSANPCGGVNAEARQALRAASRLGLDVEVGGREGPASVILDAFGDNSIDQENG